MTQRPRQLRPCLSIQTSESRLSLPFPKPLGHPPPYPNPRPPITASHHSHASYKLAPAPRRAMHPSACEGGVTAPHLREAARRALLPDAPLPRRQRLCACVAASSPRRSSSTRLIVCGELVVYPSFSSSLCATCLGRPWPNVYPTLCIACLLLVVLL